MPPLPDEPADLLPDVGLAVVDVVVYPLGRVGLAVTVLLNEDGVGETDVVASSLVEAVLSGMISKTDLAEQSGWTSYSRVASVVDGLAGPAGLPSVDGEHEDIVAGSPGAVEEGKGHFVIVAHVELEEARSLGVAMSAGGTAPDGVGVVLDESAEIVSGSDILDGAASSGGKDVRKSKFTSNPMKKWCLFNVPGRARSG